jgi:hypothetical protein
MNSFSFNGWTGGGRRAVQEWHAQEASHQDSSWRTTVGAGSPGLATQCNSHVRILLPEPLRALEIDSPRHCTHTDSLSGGDAVQSIRA